MPQIQVQLCGIDLVNKFSVSAPKGYDHDSIINTIISESRITVETHDVFFHLDTDADCHVVHIKHLFEHIPAEDDPAICLHALLRSPDTQLADEAGIVLRLDSSPKPDTERHNVGGADMSNWLHSAAPLPTPPEAEHTNASGGNASMDSKTALNSTVLTRKRKRHFGSASSEDDSDDSFGSHITVAGRKIS